MESSDTWQETAQRLAAHPEFPDTELFELLPERGHYLGRKNGIPVVIPDLTDWATVGVLLGMVAEIVSRPNNQHDVEDRLTTWLGDLCTYEMFNNQEYNPEVPGQALAELWLELKGDTEGRKGER